MDGLKQRIIGALVLISLAVIFVPMIFDEPHSERRTTPITIPEEPPFPEVDMPAGPDSERQDYGLSPEPVTTSAADSASSPGFRMIEGDDVQGSESSATSESASTQEEPELTSETQPELQAAEQQPVEPEATETADSAEKAEFTRSLEGAWVVQLGSFGNEDNARRLRDKVLAMGLGAHLQQFTRGDSTLTRVFSGPFVNRAEADKAKSVLDKEFGLKSLVTQGGK